MHNKRVDSLIYQCSVPELHRMNSCEVMKDEHGCSECSVEFESFAPAFPRLDGRHLEELPRGIQNDECLISSHSMLLNCENTDIDFERICPCIPLPMVEEQLED